MIRVLVPEAQAQAFLAFIEQKSRENVPFVRQHSSSNNENFIMQVKQKAYTLFDDLIVSGIDAKTAISKTNYALKALGFNNVSYDITKQLLSTSGRLKLKK